MYGAWELGKLQELAIEDKPVGSFKKGRQTHTGDYKWINKVKESKKEDRKRECVFGCVCVIKKENRKRVWVSEGSKKEKRKEREEKKWCVGVCGNGKKVKNCGKGVRKQCSEVLGKCGRNGKKRFKNGIKVLWLLSSSLSQHSSEPFLCTVA